MIKIVFFYSRLTGYVEGTLQALSSSLEDININVVFWDHNKLLPYDIAEIENVNLYPRSSLDTNKLYSLLIQAHPDILYISGWMDRGYLLAAFKYKRQNNNVKIIAGIDDQWKGTLKQYLGIAMFKLAFNKLFDYLWVAGKPQYHYAQMMGYKNDRIIPNLLSANTHIFKDKVPFSKRIVFLGRFAPEKGLINLLDEYEKLSEPIKNEWPLILIGGGILEEEIVARKSIHVTITPFLQSFELLNELKKGGVFCLPSISEPWGVVIHELAILGYPLLLSSKCGANTEFLIEGYNGYSFDPSKEGDLFNAMTKLVTLTPEKINLFSNRSYFLGKRINSELSAYSLLSIFEINKRIN